MNIPTVPRFNAVNLWMLRKKKLPRWVLVFWNTWGIACLLVIVVLAIGTSPKVAMFGTEPVLLCSVIPW